MKEIKKVQEFVSQVVSYEYDFNIKRNKLEGTRNEFIEAVYKFFDAYVFSDAESSFSTITAWAYGTSEESRMRTIAGLCERKLFAIEEYAGAKYDSVIDNENTSGNLFVCYMGYYIRGVLQNCYNDRWMVTKIDGSYKIVAVECADSSSPSGWEELREWKSIEDFGSRVNTLKLIPPDDEKDLIHYNSL